MWRHTASVDYAIKILICLANEKRALSSSLLANHVETSPRYVLYICKKLKDAGIVLTIFYKGIMPSEKILDLPVDCNFLTGSVNL